jgi:type IV pilus assembly protein PilP
MRNYGALMTLLLCSVLIGCEAPNQNDLQVFIAESNKIEAQISGSLSEIKLYEPVIYDPQQLHDPFRLRKPELAKLAINSALAPDLKRPRMPLEEFDLGSLSVVGTLTKNKSNYALIQTPEGLVMPAKVADYIGKNFGKIVRITDTEVHLNERIQNDSGSWEEKLQVLILPITQDKSGKGK